MGLNMKSIFVLNNKAAAGFMPAALNKTLFVASNSTAESSLEQSFLLKYIKAGDSSGTTKKSTYELTLV